MRFICTKFHGVLDYISGLLLIASPWIFNFEDAGAAQWVSVIVGAMILIMSIFTDYEAGMIKLISMPGHLTMDILTGLFLALSPWIFGFADHIYIPHLIIGLVETGAGIFTETNPHTMKHHQRNIRQAH
jgi:hypothetical protein